MRLERATATDKLGVNLKPLSNNGVLAYSYSLTMFHRDAVVPFTTCHLQYVLKFICDMLAVHSLVGAFPAAVITIHGTLQ
jgi:hypothetical protein